MIIESYGLSRKLFADDVALYKSFHPGDPFTIAAARTIESCCLEITSWIALNRLKLHDDKTEAILCGSDASLRKFVLELIQVGASDITLSDTY